MTRTSNGRFAVGNGGGPGRPKRSEDMNRHFLSTVQRIINDPDRFTDRQREALVNLVTSLVEDGPDHQAIAAASVLVKMSDVE